MSDYHHRLTLRAAATAVIEEHFKHTSRYRQAYWLGEELCARFQHVLTRDITTDMLREWAQECAANGNAISTVNIKLSFVSKLLDHNSPALIRESNERWEKPMMPWLPKGANIVKWWLTPDLEREVLDWVGPGEFADYIEWTTWTGLRVTESLRLQRHHFANYSQRSTCTMSVPGTKTQQAQRTVPLFNHAHGIAVRRLSIHASPTTRMFTMSYDELRDCWQQVRTRFNLHKEPTATVKNLRRSFAKRATNNNMPTEMLRLYLGHEDIKTTQGYLRVVGGADTEVLRQWVS